MVKYLGLEKRGKLTKVDRSQKFFDICILELLIQWIQTHVSKHLKPSVDDLHLYSFVVSSMGTAA
jgi:hypothetical protein